MFQQFLLVAFPEPLRIAFEYLFVTAPIWLPVLLAIAFARLWMTYVQAQFITKQEYVLLELILPRKVAKSPLAMETVLAGLHLGFGESTFIDRWILGKVRPWFSLELVSIGGIVHFYVWTRASLRRIVENNLYAQYPSIIIREADDYTRRIRFDLNEIGVWGCDFTLSAPDVYPIKTYVDYGLDKDQKEEYKVDPLAHLLEFLASAKSHEQVWIQLLIRVNKAEKKVPGKNFAYMSWKEEAQYEIAHLRANPDETISLTDGTQAKVLSDSQKEKIKTIERSITKPAFDVIMRGVYIAPKNSFDGTMIPALLGCLKQFNSSNYNSFIPTRYLAQFNYPWQDFQEIRQNKQRYRLFDAFRKRSGFYAPYTTKPFVLNTEELVTLYHIPSESVETQTLQRVPSLQKTAPKNLPVE